MAARGGCERDQEHKMNKEYQSYGELESVQSNRRLRINVKKCPYDGVILQMELHGAEAWGMKSVERRKVNVLWMKCLRMLVRGIVTN